MAEIKLIGTDVDGTLTDAGMYYSADGDVMKKFNTHDGMGLKLCQQAGIKTAILTSENTPIVAKRAEKLKIDYLFQGMKSKLVVITNLCKELGIGLENVAYIGDDINDFEILSAVGSVIARCENPAQFPAVLFRSGTDHRYQRRAPHLRHDGPSQYQ